MEGLLELIQKKRLHVERMAAAHESSGEVSAMSRMSNWHARPKGRAFKNILAALLETGFDIKGSSFDVVGLPEGV